MIVYELPHIFLSQGFLICIALGKMELPKVALCYWPMLDKFFDSGELKLAIFTTPQKWKGGGGSHQVGYTHRLSTWSVFSVITCKVSLISM